MQTKGVSKTREGVGGEDSIPTHLRTSRSSTHIPTYIHIYIPYIYIHIVSIPTHTVPIYTPTPNNNKYHTYIHTYIRTSIHTHLHPTMYTLNIIPTYLPTEHASSQKDANPCTVPPVNDVGNRKSNVIEAFPVIGT